MSTSSHTGTRSLTVDLVAIACAVGMTAVVAPAVVLPILRDRANAHSLALRHTEALSRGDKASQVERGLRASLTESTDRLSRARVHPQPFSSLNRKLAALTDLATTSGLMLEQLNYGQTFNSVWATSVEIKASGQAEVSAWLRFVADLHQKHPDTAIIGFRLTDSAADKTRTPGPGDNKAGAVRTVLFSMDLVWHAAPSAQILATPAAPR
jgi:hypothetical protein